MSSSSNSQNTEANIQLDELVLSRCFSLLTFVQRFRFELINRYNAAVLHRVYHLEKYSLAIRKESTQYFWGDGKQQNRFHLIFIIPRRNEQGTKKTINQLHLYQSDKRLMTTLQSIFSRLKWFKCLQYYQLRYNSDYYSLSNLFSDEKYNPIRVLRLEFLGHGAYSDWNLIEKLSHTLRELNFHCLMPSDREISKSMWTSVATCTNLKKLSFRLSLRLEEGECGIGGNVPDAHSNQHMRECLQTMNISHFRGEYLENSYNEVWLQDCFKNNDNLRYLALVQQSRIVPNMLSSSRGLELVHKLRKLEINATDIDQEDPTEDAMKSKIFAILNALPRTGYLKAAVQCKRVTNERFSVPIANLLRFWLKMSNDAGRVVKLRLAFPNEKCAQIPTAEIQQISMENQSLVAIEKDNNRTVLRYNNAKIVLTTCVSSYF